MEFIVPKDSILFFEGLQSATNIQDEAFYEFYKQISHNNHTPGPQMDDASPEKPEKKTQFYAVAKKDRLPRQGNSNECRHSRHHSLREGGRSGYGYQAM